MTAVTREVPIEAPRRKVSPQGWFWWAIGFMTLAQLVLRGWAAGGGWFYWDDFWWHDIVARNDVWETAGMSLGGHYSPLTYIPYYVMTAAFPYDWASRVVVMLITLMGINAGVLAVSRRLWPTRGPQLAVYVLWAFSSLAAPSWLWYSQFSMMGALLLTSTWTLWAYLRALSAPGGGSSLLAVGLLALSLFTQERMLVTAGLMGLFLVTVCEPTMPLWRWSERRGLGAASLAVMLLWAIVYLSLPRTESPVARADTVISLIVDMVRVSAIPSLLGGPWMLDDEPVLGRSAPTAWMQMLAVGTLVVLVYSSWRLRRRAWVPWSILALGIFIDAALVSLVRGSTMQELAIGEWRYFSDLAVLAPLLMVSAFVAPGETPVWSRGQLNAAAGTLSVFVVAALLTAVSLGMGWHRSLSRPFVQTALNELQREEPTAVMDTVLPETVANGALGAQRFASRVFSIADSRVTFDAPSTEPVILDPSGRLVPATVSPARRSALSGECVYPIDGVETTWIPLSGPSDIGHWGVAVDYVSDEPVTLVITNGAQSVDAQIPLGRHTLYVPLSTTTEQVGAYLTAQGQRLCIDEVRVGTAQPDDYR